ncbi:Permeases of the major facilitator superfamily [hydrothermal vent metagenome]|uniref:Permeases of the major facilitator superfamily n=1 Tax=hydrothermal vent metagenome TaxID=652676 RepID=A0A1W1EA57_9ZZZZ
MPIKDVRISKIIPLRNEQNRSISAHNRAVKISVGKAYLLSRLKGLDAGYCYTYLVLDINMTNILPTQKVAVGEDGSSHPSSWIGESNENYTYKNAIPGYEVPNFANHLFVRLNGSHEMPMSPMTWALGKPLLPIDATSLYIDGNRSRSGMLLFRIPDKSIKSLSLHFYDTAYGHIDLPIIGTVKQHLSRVEVLPKYAPAKLSDAFGLGILGRRFDQMLAGTKAPKGTEYETLILAIDSKLNALLALDPQKRFRLKIDSPFGAWMLKPAPVTRYVPLGLYDALSLAPGSHNRFALVFEVPTLLKNAPQSLVVSLKGKDKEVPIEKTGTHPKPINVLAKGKAEGIALALNGLYRLDQLDGYSENYLLADVTLDEKEDGSAARLHTMLQLSSTPRNQEKENQNSDTPSAVSHRGLGNFSSKNANVDRFRSPDSKTESRVLGCDGMAPDGYKKRCLLLFDLDGYKAEEPLYLTSPIFSDFTYTVDLKQLKKLDNKAFPLLAKRQKLTKESWERSMQKVLKKIRQQRIAKGESVGREHKRTVSFESSKDIAKEVVPLSASYAGAQKMQQAKDFEDALKMLGKIRWIPAATEGAICSSETMFTQGWGTEYEMTNFLYRMLKVRHIKIDKGYYYLSKEGKKALASKANGIPLKYDKVPYLAWEENGESHSVVIPFLKDAAMLRAMLKDKSIRSPLGSKSAEIRMELYYEEKDIGTVSQVGGMAAALGGGSVSKQKRETLYSESFRLVSLSNMPVDVFFLKGKNKKGESIYTVRWYGPDGLDDEETDISADIVPKRLKIKCYNGMKYLDTYTFRFEKGQKLEDIFFTFAFSMPDISKDAIAMMDKEREKRFAHISKAAPLSQLQWTNRTKIYNFSLLQTLYEKTVQKKLNVSATRHKTPRVLMAMVEKRNGKLRSTLDLRSVEADVYGKKEDVHSFNLMDGLYSSKAEAASVPHGKDLFSLWMEKKRMFLTILPKKEYRSVALKMMKKNGFDKEVRERFESSDKVMIIPKDFSPKDGWLEIDPESYRLVSVLPNGMYGAMTETILTQENIETTTRYFLGLLIGSNIAVGSVINYALLGEETFEKLKAKSHKLAKVLGCYAKKFETAAGDPIRTAKSAAKDAIGKEGDAISNMIESTFDCKDGGDSDDDEKPKEYKDFVNFGKGIDHAISNYFKYMK